MQNKNRFCIGRRNVVTASNPRSPETEDYN